MVNQDALLDEQIAYYQARSHEYDEWFFRQGRYDRGEELNSQWFSEVKQVRRELDEFKPVGHVLEIACGTGLWTEQIIQHAEQITAIDAVSEVLAINQVRVDSSKVRYLQANIFEWQPKEQYDTIFFGFWLSHVPPEKFEAFWELVKNALKAEGRVFFVDSRYNPTSTATNHKLEGTKATTVSRRLNDGREYRIVKVFYEVLQLAKKLDEMGWQFKIEETFNYFMYGRGQKAP
ncbi:MAG: class I SAM-dependent methyltransferase [Proteobacteria bacterium]|nr:class I SAM-dependent methyltransferase [Pseudomonadota bacterium]